MCVIIVKPSGVPVPADDVIEKCFEANSHGAGFAYSRGGEVHIRKGFMTLPALRQGLQREQIRKSETAVYHFRLASASDVTPAQTHPFPCDGEGNIGKLEVTTKCALAHNGHIRSLASAHKKYSDTALLASEIFSDPAVRENITSPGVKRLVEALLDGDRLVLLFPERYIMFGEWEREKGLWFSNLYWRHRWIWASWGSYTRSRTQAAKPTKPKATKTVQAKARPEENGDRYCPLCLGKMVLVRGWSSYYECEDCGYQATSLDETLSRSDVEREVYGWTVDD